MDNTSKSKRGLVYESGDKYGIVTLTGKSYIGKHSQRMVEIICNCGKIGWSNLSLLKSGKRKSCGCLSKESLRQGRISHGLCYHKLYKLWSHMIDRCHNPNSDSFYNYGARGIYVCKEWRNAEVFIKWAENNGWIWKSGLTLERIDNNKGYYPDNCKWATKAQQSRNKRSNVNLTLFGETKCVYDWSKDVRCPVAYNTISRRITKMGWGVEKAILTPPMT